MFDKKRIDEADDNVLQQIIDMAEEAMHRPLSKSKAPIEEEELDLEEEELPLEEDLDSALDDLDAEELEAFYASLKG